MRAITDGLNGALFLEQMMMVMRLTNGVCTDKMGQVMKKTE
jgi:hypothetical protein